MSASGSTSALVRLIPRLVVAGGGLALAAFLVLPEDRSSFWQAMHSAWRGDITLAFACLAAAGAILGTSFGVAALRFQTLLAGAGIALPWRTLLRAYVVASFFNLILPGAVLGDVYRFLDTRRDAGQSSLVLGLMILERLLGLSALGCLCLMALPAIPLSHASPLGRGALALFALAFTALPLIPLHPRANSELRRGLRPLSKLSPRLGDSSQRVLAAVAALAESPAVLFRAFLLSLLAQWLPVGAVYALSLPLQSEVAWYWFAVIVPFVTLVSLLPISIGGTGVRELLFIALFGAVGMKSEVALTLSLSILTVAIAWAVGGGVAFALGRHAPAAPSKDTGRAG